MVERTRDESGRIDILVNAVGRQADPRSEAAAAEIVGSGQMMFSSVRWNAPLKRSASKIDTSTTGF